MKLNFPKNSRLIFKAKKFSLPEQCIPLREEISTVYSSPSGTIGKPCQYSLVLVVTEYWTTLTLKLISFWDSFTSELQF